MEDNLNIVKDNKWTPLDKKTALYRYFLNRAKVTETRDEGIRISVYIFIVCFIGLVLRFSSIAVLVELTLGTIIGIIMYKNKVFSSSKREYTEDNIYVNTAIPLKKWTETDYENEITTYWCEIKYDDGNRFEEQTCSSVYVMQSQYESIILRKPLYIVKHNNEIHYQVLLKKSLKIY